MHQRGARKPLALKTVLARSLAGSLPDGSERLAQALVSGLGDLESAQLAIALSHVAAIARHDDPARVALERGDVATLSALPEGPTKHALAQFFAIHGDRALCETELESPRFREDPIAALGHAARLAQGGPS